MAAPNAARPRDAQARRRPRKKRPRPSAERGRGRRRRAADPRGRRRGRRHRGRRRSAVGHGSRAASRRCLETFDAIADDYKKLRQLQDKLVEPSCRATTLSPPQDRKPTRSSTDDDRHRREVAVAQQQPHRGAGRAALRHQQAPDRPRRPPAAPGRQLRHQPRASSSRPTSAPSSTRTGCARRPSCGARAGPSSSRTTPDQISDIRRRSHDAGHRDRPARSTTTAASSRRCRRASARPGRPRRKWSRPTCAS